MGVRTARAMYSDGEEHPAIKREEAWALSVPILSPLPPPGALLLGHVG